mgnify:CR=1 FL=1
MILSPINRNLFLSVIRKESNRTLIPLRFSRTIGARLSGETVTQFNVEEESEKNARLKSLVGSLCDSFGESDNFPVIVEYADVQHVFMASQTMLAQSPYERGSEIYSHIFLRRDMKCFGLSWKSTVKAVTLFNTTLGIREFLHDRENFNHFVDDIRESIGDDPSSPIADRITLALLSTDNDRLWLSLDDWAGPKHLGRCLISDTVINPSVWEPT